MFDNLTIKLSCITGCAVDQPNLRQQQNITVTSSYSCKTLSGLVRQKCWHMEYLLH